MAVHAGLNWASREKDWSREDGKERKVFVRGDKRSVEESLMICS